LAPLDDGARRVSAPPKPEAVLARISGWDGARVTSVARGSNNDAFLVDDGERRAILKIAVAGRPFPLNSRANEASVQAAAHAAGLAPAVLYVDEEVLLEEYVAGIAWTRGTFHDPARLSELAAVLRRLHALPPTGRRFPLQAAARHYRATLAPGANPHEADRQLAVIDALEFGGPLGCCHNDLVAGNVVSGEYVVLLDWEYAGDNDPLFDLAAALEHHAVGPVGAGVLLDAYFGRDAGRYLVRLERMRAAYRALVSLWSASR
jgi:thiamine kinase-like enzyme